MLYCSDWLAMWPLWLPPAFTCLHEKSMHGQKVKVSLSYGKLEL